MDPRELNLLMIQSGLYAGIAGFILFLIYLFIKTAVKNGIIAAYRQMEKDEKEAREQIRKDSLR